MTEIKVKTLPNGVRIGEYEPGNGTSYMAVAVPWEYSGSMNALGGVEGCGWLVVNCLNRLAYLFRNGGQLADDYIQEKLGGTKRDYPYLGDLIRRLLGREKL